jgi:hypothetical protein
MMDARLRRRLALLSILLIVGVIAGAAIIVLGADKVMPGSNNGYISVVKPSQTGESSDQITLQQAQFDQRANNLTAIANKDQRVSSILVGKNYTVLAIAVLAASPAPAEGSNNTTGLFVKAEGQFYLINIDIANEKVISVEQLSCYGSGCND